ncbi:MAG: LuxR C-terminal-related transcriptional regulator [bacterium]|nr:LuxR C-terminal-related transcriptional regulator [bacterium]
MSDYNFTEVEIEVLKLIVKGLEDIEIACMLEIEEDSAREIAENILAKLEARNKIQAAIKAVKAELV